MKTKNIYAGLFSLLTFCVYAQDNPDYFGAGSDAGITISTSSNFQNSTGENTINGSGLDARMMEASRFLAHSTMGYNLDEIQRVNQMGFEAWINDQIQTPFDYLKPQMEEIWDEIYPWHFDYYWNMYLEDNPGAELTPELTEQIDDQVYGPWAVDFHYAWWQNVILGNDQLRQRVAFALSQILVISTKSDLRNHAETLTSYYDYFLEHAFGNYNDILMDVTLHPAMGLYLSHYNNPKEVPEENLHPDENYAREIMQLFTIGLYELNQDGSRKVDGEGKEIPTYNNADIKELAKVFTGLGASEVMENPWVDEPFFGMDWYLGIKDVQLKMYQEWHETSSKTILGDFEIPAGQEGMEDIEMAVEYLFNHPNVGPFISRQLIQRLVKSNPSPQYISRIAAVFNNNGTGQRGDLGAIVKAILLDEEARSCEGLMHADNGRLREPMLRYTQIAKGLSLECYKDTLFTVDGELVEGSTPCQKTRYWLNAFDADNELRQSPLGAPSVFNFYLPDHQPVGEITARGLFAPEFKIHDSSSSINYINRIFATTSWNYFGGSYEGDVNEDVGYLRINPSEVGALIEDPEAVYNYLDLLFMHGQLTDRELENMRAFINESPEWMEDYHKLRGMLFIALISPDYNIMK